MNILLVDDDVRVLRSIERELRGSSVVLTTVSDPAEGIWWLGTQEFDLVVSDYRMPGINGVEVLRAAAEQQPAAARIMLSGYTDVEAMLTAVNEIGLFRYILKPWNRASLRVAIEEARQKHDQNQLANKLIAKDLAERDADIRRNNIIDDLEASMPGLTNVEFTPDGTIVL